MATGVRGDVPLPLIEPARLGSLAARRELHEPGALGRRPVGDPQQQRGAQTRATVASREPDALDEHPRTARPREAGDHGQLQGRHDRTGVVAHGDEGVGLVGADPVEGREVVLVAAGLSPGAEGVVAQQGHDGEHVVARRPVDVQRAAVDLPGAEGAGTVHRPILPGPRPPPSP